MLRYKFQILSVIFLVMSLACVRAFEQDLFYDPFLFYFKEEFTNLPFPSFENFKLFLSLSFRYFLNSILSLGIIYAVFKEFGMTKFASFLYLFFFAILIGLFFGILHFSAEENPFLLFYVRRFLIQPIFVILFLPAFYFQKNRY